MNDQRDDLTRPADLHHAPFSGPLRTRRPNCRDLMPPCNDACPAGENIPAWLASWPAIDLAADPIFKLLSDRPESQDLLDRNAELVERQKRIYLAGKEAGSAQSVGLAE
jgi:hypothetical protein